MVSMISKGRYPKPAWCLQGGYWKAWGATLREVRLLIPEQLRHRRHVLRAAVWCWWHQGGLEECCGKAKFNSPALSPCMPTLLTLIRVNTLVGRPTDRCGVSGLLLRALLFKKQSTCKCSHSSNSSHRFVTQVKSAALPPQSTFQFQMYNLGTANSYLQLRPM